MKDEKKKKCGECRWNKSTLEKNKKLQVLVPWTEPKQKKVKVEIKTEIKPSKPPKKRES